MIFPEDTPLFILYVYDAFSCWNPDEMRYDLMKQAARYYKEDPNTGPPSPAGHFIFSAKHAFAQELTRYVKAQHIFAWDCLAYPEPYYPD